ncbi:MAG: 16S rRNA (guanine(527)-N(7))-methyltransferase RsmG [Hyphomicrobiaceae bacterium]|nr:16S rRNA (guanine(527)-N(7))-methyltransferase RsmG [Hyphomicrobiaceae bacterium]
MSIGGSAEFAACFGVSRETRERLETFAAELLRWQKTINLVAPGTLPHLWHRHFADSAQLVGQALQRTGDGQNARMTWIDLGSGGGFPGLVAAIMLAPDAMAGAAAQVTLIESDSRKAAFLRNVARQAGVPVDILCERAEVAATRSNLHGATVVSARALAPMTRLLVWSAPFAGRSTVLLLPKGKEVAAELQDAEKSWKFDCDLVPSLTDPEARIAVVTNLMPRS